MKTNISTELKKDGGTVKSVVVDLKVPDLSAVANFQTVHARAHNEFIPTL